MVERWRHPNQRDPLTLPIELRRTPLTQRLRGWVRSATGSPVQNVRRLPGASSTAVHLVSLANGVTLVLRTYAWPGFLADEPEAPRREVDALRWAHRAGLPVPEVVAADATGSEAGVPLVLMERLRGRAQASPCVEQLAELVAQVHAVSGTGFGHEWFPWCRDTSTRPPVGAREPRVWERAQELWRDPPPEHHSTFIHRDLHPGNVLWLRSSATGIVDWANACQGPAGVDVATCRWNLHNWSGAVAAEAFVLAYERVTGTAQHPYWDLASLLEDDWDLGRPATQLHNVEKQLASILARYA